jgi:hypothetical protein
MGLTEGEEGEGGAEPDEARARSMACSFGAVIYEVVGQRASNGNIIRAAMLRVSRSSAERIRSFSWRELATPVRASATASSFVRDR